MSLEGSGNEMFDPSSFVQHDVYVKEDERLHLNSNRGMCFINSLFYCDFLR